MPRLVFLDSGPLGLLANPKGGAESLRCKAWVNVLTYHGDRVVIPEIADYEVRRELVRGKKVASLGRLDGLASVWEYLPLMTAHMRKAAELWAEARTQGYPTAADKALDGDVILAAQALLSVGDGEELVVATTNPDHLCRFLDARPWQEIA